MTFAQTLERGRVGESRIARWFISRGYAVLPVYETEISAGKGPRLFAPTGEIVAPDMFVFRIDKAAFIEAKHKTAFTWYRKGGYFCTGIDARHYAEYLRFSDLSQWPVWLLFLHLGGQAKDSPPSPSGLYGGNLSELKNHISHTHENFGKSGGVFWNIAHLKKLANVEDL